MDRDVIGRHARRRGRCLRDDAEASGNRVLTSDARELQLPRLRTPLHVVNHDALPMPLRYLGEQRQRIVRRDEDDCCARCQRIDDAMNGCVSHSVRNLAGVELGERVMGGAAATGGVLFGDVELGHEKDITTGLYGEIR